MSAESWEVRLAAIREEGRRSLTEREAARERLGRQIDMTSNNPGLVYAVSLDAWAALRAEVPRTWDTMPSEQMIRDALLLVADAEQALGSAERDLVAAARHYKISWDEIGMRLGFTTADPGATARSRHTAKRKVSARWTPRTPRVPIEPQEGTPDV